MKAGGCKPEFQVMCSTHSVYAVTDITHSVYAVHLALGMRALQEWSKCVDDERKQGKDFTEECRERVT